MSDNIQAPMSQLPAAAPPSTPAPADVEVIDEEGDAAARVEVKRLSLSNEKLRMLAKKYPPPPEYFEGDEEMPFVPIEE